MKILWITNTLFPEASERLTGKGELRGSGGWMLASAEMLVEQDGVKLFVATVSSLVKKIEIIEGKNITYFVLPYGKGNLKYNKEYESHWLYIKKQINPDVVHIHGTEFLHGFAYIKACGNEHVVVSVQGLKSGIAPYYCAGLSRKDIYRNITFHDILKGSIYSEQRSFYRTGKLEKELLRSVNHIIGRTSWDRAHVWAINPRANYYVCNETLRSEFYDGSIWDYEKCEKQTIFLSQAGYPIKGLHQVIKAMPLILREYPNTRIRIAGRDITRNSTIVDKLRLTGYGKVIRKMIKKYHLEAHVEFLGPLNAEEMKREYLNANVFVCPSTIENSPNSLGEAQLLGVPCVASYVGGIPDFMLGNEPCLYRFEEFGMLAELVCKIFIREGEQIDISNIALQRHNAQTNLVQLLEIYKEIL